MSIRNQKNFWMIYSGEEAGNKGTITADTVILTVSAPERPRTPRGAGAAPEGAGNDLAAKAATFPQYLPQPANRLWKIMWKSKGETDRRLDKKKPENRKVLRLI